MKLPTRYIIDFEGIATKKIIEKLNAKYNLDIPFMTKMTSCSTKGNTYWGYMNDENCNFYKLNEEYSDYKILKASRLLNNKTLELKEAMLK